MKPVAQAIKIALLVAGLCVASMHAQVSRPQADGTATLAGTIYDPLGRPAEHTLILLASSDPSASLQTRTDASGRFLFDGLPPGMYGLITPASDQIEPGVAELTANTRIDLDVRLSIEPTAYNLRVCRDCKADDYKLVELIRTEATKARDEQSAAILAAAEPEEGWNTFNERPLGYPPGLRGTRLQGAVVIDGTITADGVVANLQVISSPDTRLTAAALDLVQAQHWRPARVRTMPVESPLHATVEFTIRGF